METIKARVENVDDDIFLKIDASGGIRIPISAEQPNDVKIAFNRLIDRIKLGPFAIELEKVNDDLFSQVAKEYITQLNSEIQEIHGEMREYGLLTEDGSV